MNLLNLIALTKHRRTPIVLQAAQTECGAATLASILRYYGRYRSLNTLHDQCGITRDGCSISTIIKVAKKEGLQAEAYKISVDMLKNLDRPVIGFYKDSHYLIINEVKKQNVFINDPAHGEYKLSLSVFAQSFSGIVIAFMPGAEFKKCKSPWHVKNHVCSTINQYKKSFSIALICLGFGLLGPFISMFLTRIIIDHVLIKNETVWLLPCFNLTITAGIGCLGLAAIAKYNDFHMATLICLRIIRQYFNHIIRLPYLFYSLHQKSSIIMLYLRAEQSITSLSLNLIPLFVNIVVSLFIFIILITLNPHLGLFLLLYNLITSLILILTFRNQQSLGQSQLKASGNFYSLIISTMKNLESMKISGHTLVVLNPLKNALDILAKTRLLVANYNLIRDTVALLLSWMVMILIISTTVYVDKKNLASIGGMLSILYLNSILNGCLCKIIYICKELVTAIIPYGMLKDVMSLNIDQRYNNQDQLYNTSNSRGIALSCKNIYFSYGQYSESIVNNVNLEIVSGSQVAFVGESGSGKSTLASIFSGLWLPTSGKLELMGYDLSLLSAQTLKTLVAYMGQNAQLFSGTIYQNLTFGCDNVSDEKLYQVIDICNLRELVNNYGLNADVGEGGSNLSGGERQRINMARLLLTDAKILIFDEATSALDIETEHHIIENMKMINKTIIFIAHRLESIKHCECIYVMKNGSIVEYGTHKFLLSQQSYYNNLYNNVISHDYQLAV